MVVSDTNKHVFAHWFLFSLLLLVSSCVMDFGLPACLHITLQIKYILICCIYRASPYCMSDFVSSFLHLWAAVQWFESTSLNEGRVFVNIMSVWCYDV